MIDNKSKSVLNTPTHSSSVNVEKPRKSYGSSTTSEAKEASIDSKTEADPLDTGADFSTISDLQGPHYLDILAKLHRVLNPKTYLEIGTNFGDSLKIATCASIAIDPEFIINENVIGKKPKCNFMQMGSDDFFQQHNPEHIFGSKVDFAFLDGMHWYEYLLRDFMNIEKFCRPNSVIAVHDCLPVDPFVARREATDARLQPNSKHPNWWAGDVWKAVAILLKARPDLRIQAFDASPTGLVLITNLDPTNTALSDNYFELVESMRLAEPQDGSLAQFFGEIGITPCSTIDNWSEISHYFWL